MNIIYFIGPSGVGKSAICEELIKESGLNVEYEELDKIYIRYKKNEGNHQLAVEKTEERLQEIEKLNDDKIYLVDVGSFAQKYVNISLWEIRSGQLVCLKNDMKFCYKNYNNRPTKRMSFDSWKKSEFGARREKVYSLANYTVDSTNLEISTTKAKVLEIINQIMRSDVCAKKS